jgi:hypothetical protein
MHAFRRKEDALKVLGAQGSCSSGGWKRLEPTGGAAYGIDRKAATEGDDRYPWTLPSLGMSAMGGWLAAAIARGKTMLLIIMLLQV